MNISSYFFTMRNLMEIKRYQNKITLVPRTIAEHKFSYSKIAYMLSYWEKRLGESVKTSEMLESSIFDGTIKAITGDIQSNNLDATSSIRTQIDTTYNLFYDSSYKLLLPLNISKNIKAKVLHSKNDTIEGRIIKSASLINRFLECLDEVSLGNTIKFQSILEDTFKELLSIDNISTKLFLSELPNNIYNYTAIFNKEINKNRIYIYNNLNSIDILEFRNTFFNFSSEIRGLMEIERYQNIFKHRKRTVAEHQWFVTLVSIFIYYFNFDSKIDLESLLVKGLFHDDIELYTGDILSNTKNTLSSTKDEVEKVEEKYYNDFYSKFIPFELNHYLKPKILQPKDNTIEGNILSLADIIDTIYEADEEIILGNSLEFENIKRSSLNRAYSFYNKFDSIDDIINDLSISKSL